MRPVFSSFTPAYKIAYLFLFLLMGVVTAGILTKLILMIPGLSNGGKVTAIYVGSVMQSVVATALPAYLIAALTHAGPVRYLKMTGNGRTGEKVMFAVLVFLFSYLLASFLSQWNKGMELPASMREMEQVLRSLEDAALETTNLLLSGDTVRSLILNLLVVAGLAALSEEMFFRGALQQFIQEKFPNGHVAVWLTALIFSVVHFQFYGFLPRLLLGGLLGYLFLYTRNLWISVIFHFINNAVIIIMHYFWGDSQWIREIEKMPVTGSFALAAGISGLCTFLLFRVYRRRNPETVKTKRIVPEVVNRGT
ncbi:CPBP family intramembrane glutamic endopeptidase [uncultured Proteiniphilum sp.]|uniref:CPBP family intramembrane glutamic endopeptidase n=1 Tax=uncultured Proteiniphilum sp. TaxID=497637 RepID=UPI00262018EA|nr:CPBP family intramembrane glutamic endopeptidase [uncultured Proteiniphilum sp.]